MQHTGEMAHQMLIMLWLWLAFSSISSPLLPLQLQVQADWNYSSNPADYDFGWFANGTYPSGLEPYCKYCINALTYDPNEMISTPADQAKGVNWNLTVGTYRCDGVQPNEMWAYHEPTQTIVFGNLSQVLCIDAVDWSSLGRLKLRSCNSSAVSQNWKRNGSRVISALSGPQGEELFMVGAFPDKDTDPSNYVNYNYMWLNSSVPSAPVSGFTYSSDFIFLSAKNLIDRSTNRFTTQGLLQITNSSLDEIVNGDFESSTIQAGSDIARNDYNQEYPSYFSLCGWVIDYGPIDYVKAGLIEPAHGLWSIHLNTYSDGDKWGQLSQTIRTPVGNEYRLSFFFTGFPPQLKVDNQWSPNRPLCNATYQEAQLQVRITNPTSNSTLSAARTDGFDLKQNFSIDVRTSSSSNVASPWQFHFINFRASANVTKIIFTSLNFYSRCGPMIDYVTLLRLEKTSVWKRETTQIVVGSIGGLVLLIASLLGIAFGRIRFCPPEEDYSNLYKTDSARVFTVKELRASTKNFSAVLGEGGFGTVYKADFPDGMAGAVKVEKRKGLSSSKVLASDEIALLLRVHHRNLVNLIGFCIHKGRHMLVFEYLPNGSLYDRLHESAIPVLPNDIMNSIEMSRLCGNVLPWYKRTKIASDVAYGLEYLHHDADPPIVHRDVKSRNILLTATDSAKLADFGLSKSAPADATAFQSIETMVKGSIGYLDPQYFHTGVFSAKSDVYSYGVVLLELISGHQAIYNAASLSSWAAPYLASPSLYHELVDKRLHGEFKHCELESLVELSMMCMQEDSRMRPNMRQVVAFLNARGLVVSGGESAERIEESVSSETHRKMELLDINLEAWPNNSIEWPLVLHNHQPMHSSTSNARPIKPLIHPCDSHIIFEIVG